MYRETAHIVLASASPRRRELLSRTGIAFQVSPARMEEPPAEEGEAAPDYVGRMARLKGLEVAARFPRSVVLAADTAVVAPDGEVMGKPRDAGDALRMLQQLAGNDHQVVTGCALVSPNRPPHAFTVATTVRFAPVPAQILQAYAASEEPRDKAGAYAIQGEAAALVESISGSWTNVVGLPLAEVMEVLMAWGVVACESS
ncbi:Maf family protein [Desulfohalovibrio reitneri]|uniref:Maf family protein n=1 Tax=Desulfohalovibrio reitneri TaxID=1307759 RepID=UPI0004A71C92|nr:Maf family protein [Desulfohalovibrio reitneri]